MQLLKFLLFKPLGYFLFKRAAINREFYRWKYRKNFSADGPLFIAATAKLDFKKGTAKLITKGLSLHDYSQIILNHDNSSFTTGKDVSIYKFCIFNIWDGSIEIGENVSVNNYCSFNCMNGIKIGNNTWLGEGVRLYDHNHKFRGAALFVEQGFTSKNITIGDNCWIGTNTVILQGVEIGNNCVIGANNLIYQSVPDNTIVKAKAMEIMENIKRNNE